MTVDELKNCQGVGEGKARKFGKPFIELIAKYVEENEIIRPDDFVVKSVVNRSANKVFIIQSIDRKLPFEDIARNKDMDLDRHRQQPDPDVLSDPFHPFCLVVVLISPKLRINTVNGHGNG